MQFLRTIHNRLSEPTISWYEFISIIIVSSIIQAII